MPRAIIEKIEHLRKSRKALILAHLYQTGDVQDIADRTGDSLELARYAAGTDAAVIVLCGVRFMAESAKLLNPEKTVLLPAANAGCPMAEMLDADALVALKAKHPGAIVVCYVNSTAEVKAESDICCTSSNAVRIVRGLPADRPVIFVPDRNLGDHVAQATGRELILHPGYCPTHQRLLPEIVRARRAEYPDAQVLAHPECMRETRALADFVGSTSEIIERCRGAAAGRFIIATENGVLHRLRRDRPDCEFIAASDEQGVCPNMKRTTLELILAALEGDLIGVTIPADLAARARQPLERMLALS